MRYGRGFDFQDCRHRHFGGGAQSVAGALRPGGTGHDDHPGGTGGGDDDDGAGDQRSL